MLAVHVQHPARASPGVQIVDILGNDQQLTLPAPVQLCQRRMRRVGQLFLYRRAAHVVETQHQIGIARKSFWRSDILDAVLLPQSPGGTESVDPALGADPGTGQDHDVANLSHHSP